MSHSEKCPVCQGSGQLMNMNPQITAGYYTTTCNGCNGKGWITVEDSTPPLHWSRFPCENWS